MKIWTAREMARALELRIRGIPWKDVARELGRSESSVWVKLHGLGIKLRADGNDREAVRENLLRLHQQLIEKAEAEERLQDIAAEESLPAPVGPSAAKTLADTTVGEDLEATRQSIILAEARESKRKYAEVLQQRAVEDRIVDIFRERMDAFLPTAKTPPVATAPRLSPHPHRRESAVLLVGDTHVGQVVSRSQTNGFGDYCPKIFCERLHYLEERVVEILRQAPSDIDELHVILLGDIVHGMLNHGAEREDTLLVADQFQLAVWCLHQFLCRLAEHVPQLKVATVVGNHGRWAHQRRMPTKHRFSNLDHLVYSALQLSVTVHGATNITINLNDAPRQVLDVKGARFLIAHGDHLRGGDRQFGIPIHSMTRDVNATCQRYAAAEEKSVDYYLVGDKHRSMSLPLASGEYIVNGSLVGTDEFSMTFAPSEPMQMLFAVDPILKKTWAYPIKVAHAPGQEQCPYDLPAQIRYLVSEQDPEKECGLMDAPGLGERAEDLPALEDWLDATAVVLPAYEPSGFQLEISARTLSTHVLLLGQTGSGKSSVLRWFFQSLIGTAGLPPEQRAGLFIFDLNADATPALIRLWAERAGRQEDVRLLTPEEGHLDLFAGIHGLEDITLAVANLSYGDWSRMGGENLYWSSTARNVVDAILTVCLATEGVLRLGTVIDVFRGLLTDPRWPVASPFMTRFHSMCEQAADHLESGSVTKLMAARTTMGVWHNLDGRTRNILASILMDLMNPLVSLDTARYLDAGRGNLFAPEEIVNGRILVFSTPSATAPEASTLLGKVIKARLYAALQSANSTAVNACAWY